MFYRISIHYSGDYMSSLYALEMWWKHYVRRQKYFRNRIWRKQCDEFVESRTENVIWLSLFKHVELLNWKSFLKLHALNIKERTSVWFLMKYEEWIFVPFSSRFLLECHGCSCRRGRVVRAPDLKLGFQGFKSRSDHCWSCFLVFSVLTPRPCF